ncbi:MAG: (Fe-S)-binding protein [bacterium]
MIEVTDHKTETELDIIKKLIKHTRKREFKYAFYIEHHKHETINRPRRFLEAFAAVLKFSNYKFLLDLYSRISTKCTRCACTCQIYQATGDLKDIPCYRSNLLLGIYKRHFTYAGWLRGKFIGNGFITDDLIDELAESVYHCTACRRCFLECPMGIDHGLLTHLARYILSEIGLIPKALVVATREQLEGATHNTSAIPVPALLDTLEFLEEELKENFGIEIKFPIDKEHVDYVFFPAVSDFLLEADTLMGNAAVIHAAGDANNWTIGTQNFDGINYGLFYSDFMLGRIIRAEVAETRRLNGKNILIGECGHASRSAKFFVPTYGYPNPPPVINIMEYTAKALAQGKIRLDPNVIQERVTYHDPCNIARSGWIIDQPRFILRSFIKNYVDMTPGGRYNYCCGGGGGTVSIDEIRSYRTKITGKTKAEQIRATGADIVVAPCANCKKQLREVCEDNGLDNVSVVGLHDLILKAIRFD